MAPWTITYVRENRERIQERLATAESVPLQYLYRHDLGYWLFELYINHITYREVSKIQSSVEIDEDVKLRQERYDINGMLVVDPNRAWSRNLPVVYALTFGEAQVLVMQTETGRTTVDPRLRYSVRPWKDDTSKRGRAEWPKSVATRRMSEPLRTRPSSVFSASPQVIGSADEQRSPVSDDHVEDDASSGHEKESNETAERPLDQSDAVSPGLLVIIRPYLTPKAEAQSTSSGKGEMVSVSQHEVEKRRDAPVKGPAQTESLHSMAPIKQSRRKPGKRKRKPAAAKENRGLESSPELAVQQGRDQESDQVHDEQEERPLEDPVVPDIPQARHLRSDSAPSSFSHERTQAAHVRGMLAQTTQLAEAGSFKEPEQIPEAQAAADSDELPEQEDQTPTETGEDVQTGSLKAEHDSSFFVLLWSLFPWFRQNGPD